MALVDPNGSLTVGDRLRNIEMELKELNGRLGQVASDAEVQGIAAKLETIERSGSSTAIRAAADLVSLESRVRNLERDEAIRNALRSNRRFLLGIAIGMGAWGSVVITVALVLTGHHP